MLRRRTSVWAALCAILLLAAAYSVPTLWYRPWNLQHLHRRALLQSQAEATHPLQLLRVLTVDEPTAIARPSPVPLRERSRVARVAARNLDYLHRYGPITDDHELALTSTALDWYLRGVAAEGDHLLNADPLARVIAFIDADASVSSGAKFASLCNDVEAELLSRAESGFVPSRFVLDRISDELQSWATQHPAEELSCRQLMHVCSVLRPQAEEGDGAWRLRDGHGWYAHCLRRAMGSERSAGDLHEDGLAELERLRPRAGAGSSLLPTSQLPPPPLFAIDEQARECSFERRAVAPLAYEQGWAIRAQPVHVQRLAAARLVVDTGIHSRRWSRAQSYSFLREELGLSRGEAEAEILRVLLRPGVPGAAAAGAIRLRAMEDRARQALGVGFRRGEFLRLLRDLGPLPLDPLEERVDNWISAEIVRGRTRAREMASSEISAEASWSE